MLAARLQLDQGMMEDVAREARWRETMTNEQNCRPHHRPEATIDALTTQGHEAGIGFNEPVDAALLQSPAHGLQVATVLADKLHDMPRDPYLLANLRRVLRSMVELQDNIS